MPSLLQVEELRNSPLPFSHLSFSNDGNSLLAVAESKVLVLNAYDGKVLRKFSNGTPEGGQPPEAALSADGQFVLSGAAKSPLPVWYGIEYSFAAPRSSARTVACVSTEYAVSSVNNSIFHRCVTCISQLVRKGDRIHAQYWHVEPNCH